MDETINKGDEWPHHYRGTRYHYNTDQEVWWQTFKDGVKVPVKSGHEEIVKELLTVKPEGGSFRITETGDIITKIPADEKDENLWKEIFVCEMGAPFQFEDINPTPRDIKPGDLWTGFFDGARYVYVPDKVWWKNPLGYRQYIRGTLPDDVIVNLRMFKSSGGSFRITENGFLIALIPKQPLPNNIKQQWESFTSKQQRLVATKVDRVDMLPVYMGMCHEGIELNDPIDFNKRLNTEEKKEMLDFLDGFSIDTQFEGMVPTDIDKDELGESEEFLDDPEDFQ